MVYLKTRPAWSELLIFLGLAFGSLIILGAIGTLLLSKFTGFSLEYISDINNWDYSKPGTVILIRGLLLIQFISLFIIPPFLYAFFSDPRPGKYLGFRDSKALYFLLGVAVLFVSLPLVELTGVFNQSLVPETTDLGKWMEKSEEDASRQLAFLLQRNNLNDLLLNLLFIAGFAGFGEEVFFRGILQRIFIKLFKSPLAGIILTAIIFSAIHIQFYGFIPRFILGILLGLIYWYSGSIWPAIFAHFIYDAFFVVLVFLNPSLATQEGPVFKAGDMVTMAVVSALMVAAIIYLMKRKSTTNYAEVYAADKMQENNPFI